MIDLLLAIDQGTSGLKLSVFDTEGRVVASKTKTYPTYYPKEHYAEQDCEDWWQAFLTGIGEIFEDNKIQPEQIKGIGVDGISWALIPIDKKGQVLYKTLIWLDQRATKEAEWMKKTVGEEKLIKLSGNPVDAAYITPKMLWLKNNEPEIFAKTDKFLQSNAYLVYRLTGKLSQDRSQGYGFHFFDIKSGKLDEEIANKLGLSVDLIPPIYNSHDVVGAVTCETAKLTGLLEGTPVVAGGLDAACCTLGAGVIHSGETQEQGGQAGGMSICQSEAKIHPKLILGQHVVPGMWLLQGGTTGGGGTLNWFNREFGVNEPDAFSKMSEEARVVAPGSDGMIFLPYMKGERSPIWSNKAKGVYYGLSFDKTRGHMIRSTMEGVAYSLRHNLDTALEIGVKADVLSSVGGSANSEVWTQIKADVTGKTIHVPYADHATSLGAAILAGLGVGIYADFDDAVERTVKIRKTYFPNADNKETYKVAYERYLKLSSLMTEHMYN